MDPTTLAPMSPSASASPYAANMGPAGSINPNQLAAIIQALQAKESQGGASPPAAGQPQSMPGGQGQPAQKPPVTDISGLIPSLMHPPPTSILGQAESGIGNALGFGGQPGGSAPGGAPPLAGGSVGGMPNGGVPMPGSPGAFGSSAVPTPFASPGSPDAMTQMLMGGAPGF